ncbi:MAG TPA: type 1 glutamine amidotransferase domain-containing protein [Polyangiaceae bacterium]|nr:type 1 glutamine amidotransferase domain-containing protein [Polyangiaceae bacterium]
MAPDFARGAVRALLGAALALLGCQPRPATESTASAPAAAAAAASAQPTPASRGPVLVVLSSSNSLPLKGGKALPTGYFLNELMVPVQALTRAGYRPVFATPAGGAAVMDKHSDSASFFPNEAEYRQAKQALQQLNELRQTRALSEVLREGLEPYRGVLVPGGHAAMGDLSENAQLGQVLRHFHDARKPTGVICHGPAALLSTLPRVHDFQVALASGDTAQAKQASAGFPYAGYRLTAFSTTEEKAVEDGGASAFLGGLVLFYLDQALTAAGAHVDVGEPFKSHVVVDRELISAQQPASDGAFTRALLEALAKNDSGGAAPRQ